MSGHNRWSQIKHKKGASDAKKGILFGKLAKAISIAARDNPDPASNVRLKAEIDRARAVNMPNDNIDRAIKRVSDKNAATLSEIQVELIGPGNAAIIVQAITDNSNRTINELKQLASKNDARMAGQGAVLWMFKKAGEITITNSSDAIELAAIDAGAEDVTPQENGLVIITPVEQLELVRQAVAAAGAAVTSSEIQLIATTPQSVTDPAIQQRLQTFLEALDDQDDVQDVFTNADY